MKEYVDKKCRIFHPKNQPQAKVLLQKNALFLVRNQLEALLNFNQNPTLKPKNLGSF